MANDYKLQRGYPPFPINPGVPVELARNSTPGRAVQKSALRGGVFLLPRECSRRQVGRHWRALACEAGKLGSGLEEQAGAARDRLMEGLLGRRGALTPSRSSRT